MSQQLEGQDVSLWVASTPATDYPTLADDEAVYDAVVVGGGITGVVTAFDLQRKGLSVVLIDKARLVEWTTGGTTAKLSSQHYLIYDYLIRQHGRAIAQAFADANEAGIDRVESLAGELGIDCEFARCDAYVYSGSDDKLTAFHAEVEAAQQLGLPAAFTTDIDLPFTIAGAVKFSHQAQFHPRKFLLGLLDRFTAGGGVVYENTEATDITGGDPATVHTNHGPLRGRAVVQASGEPFWNNDLFDSFRWLKMSYALGVRLRDDADYPASMYITTDDPMRTIRTASYEGRPLLIFGGESHEYDDDTFDADLHQKNLIADVRSKYDVDAVLFRWLAGDYMPYDRMPYIGSMPGHTNIYAITGYRAWGLAWAMSAAAAIADEITGDKNTWVEPFSLDRLATPLPDSAKTHGL